METSNKKVIIVGAGIGGLASALRLLSKGYKVVIYEKNQKVGGVVNQFKQAGYTFDLTATLSLLPQNFSQLFAEINLKEELEEIPNDLLYRVFNATGEKIDFSTDFKQLTKMMEYFSKEDSIGYFKLVADIYEKYDRINDKFLTQSFEKAPDFFNLDTMKNIFKINPFQTTEQYISRYIDNEMIRNYLCFQAMYIGLSPYDSSDAYSLLPGVTQLYGLPYFKGGMYAFIEQIESLIVKLGGTIYCGQEVTELIVEQDSVKGVKIKDTCDFSEFVLVNGNCFEMRDKLLENSDKLSCSVFILYLGIKKELSNLNVHNIYIGDNFKENIESMFKGNLPDKPSVYIYSPSRLDASMAPTGCECLNVMMRVPNLSSNIRWTDEVIKMLKDKIYHILEQILDCGNLEKYIEVEKVLTPKDLEIKFGCVKGAAFGLGHHLLQTNYFRPHYHSETYKNLFFVGASNHPGTGISLVLNSAKLVVEEIDKHISKN